MSSDDMQRIVRTPGAECNQGNRVTPVLLGKAAILVFFYGIALVIGAAILRMNASLALAVRDIAINSFR